ncbi:hypothetical protein [Roseomonas xinghualingensis]|uniref:hypothetical protein n=1 Tax=Roseomonas xinghualingensis TaxID=2986475 RepID=UPI0021F20C92|nr:hypothetical protein [Roseomonas sp. SXEYE001]
MSKFKVAGGQADLAKKKPAITLKKFRELVLRNRWQIMSDLRVHKSYEEQISLDFSFNINDSTKEEYGTFSITANIDLSENYYYLFDVHEEDFGIFLGEYEDNKPILYKTPNIGGSLKIEQIILQPLERTVTLNGILKSSYKTVLKNDIIAVLSIDGLKNNDVPGEFFLETIGEALALRTEKRLKQAYFTYLTAIDSQTNFHLRDLFMYSELKDLKRMELSDKFRLNLKRFISNNEIEKVPLISRLLQLFNEHFATRNAIAHGIKRINVTASMIEDIEFLFLCVEMIANCQSAELPRIVDDYKLLS